MNLQPIRVGADCKAPSPTIMNVPNYDENLSQVAVIVPTRNAEAHFEALALSLIRQRIAPRQVLIIDSESEDRTVELARAAGFQVHIILRREFNHGGTRALGAHLMAGAEILVYMTQDASLAFNDSLLRLVSTFCDPDIGAAYGRQLPHSNADPFARHASAFNYPAVSTIRTLDSRATLGFKAAFLSNSFSAYRHSALESVGGFPSHVIMGEDTYVAAKLMLRGWKTAYVAEAAAFHSHNLTSVKLFRRYFATGVLHAREAWIQQSFGRPHSEGIRSLRSELTFLRTKAPNLIPKCLLRTLIKYTAYKLGKSEASLPKFLKRQFSELSEYWRKESGVQRKCIPRW